MLYCLLEYSYNPCKGFTEGAECIDVAACQSKSVIEIEGVELEIHLVSMDGLYQFALGRHSTITWNPGAPIGGRPTIKYTAGEKTVEVILECSRTGADIFEALGEEPINYYKFRLENKCACWDGCSGQGKFEEKKTRE